MSTSAGRRSSSNSGRGGRGGRGGMPKESAAARNAREIASLHEASTRWQAENHAPRESLPSEHGKVTNGQLQSGAVFEPKPGYKPQGDYYNPFASGSSAESARLYGDEQLGAALSRWGTTYLKTEAAHYGLSTSGSRSDLLSRLTAHVTGGHYSANFPKESAAKTTSRAATAPTRTKPVEQMSRDEMIAHIQALETALAGRSRGTRGAAKSDLGPTPTPIRHGTVEQLVPYGSFNPYRLTWEYGHDQMRSVYARGTQRDLQDAVRQVKQRNPGTQPGGRTRQQLIDYLVTHVTDANAEAPRGA